VLEELAQLGCAIVFSNSYGYGEDAKQVAAEYPDTQFCEATCDNANDTPIVSNYHTFMGEIYEGRYVTGKIAGMKLNEMIESGQIDADDVWVGYVGAYPYAEVISGYTAFFLGVRSECPQARMRVQYTNTWGSYGLEMRAAKELINKGCVIIAQHTNTIAPAIACEEASTKHPVYHIGYNQDMVEIAPTVSIIGTRINWTPYCVGAVQAMFENKKIEDVVEGHVHGNDMGAGFKEDWVTMLTLNTAIAPKGSEAMIDTTVASLSAGTCPVFVGDYIGIDPVDKTDTWDLRTEYHENESSSAPTFHYVLQDVISVG
jgi:basic membrane protein A